MMKPDISVIVPVYNVEAYLERCVKSIQAQTFSSFEIILVDDGSTDQSGIMCDKMAAEDSSIRVIHKENGGLSDARNVGMDAALGQYLFFVDSDDYISQDALEILIDLIRDHDAQIAIGGICDSYAGNDTPQRCSVETFICSGTESLKYMLEGKRIPGSACGKLYTRSVCDSRRFIVGKTYEDAFFLPEVLLDSQKVAVTTTPVYNYWHRKGSITTGAVTEKSMDVVRAYEYTETVVEQRCPQLLPQAEFRLHWAYFVVLDRLMEHPDYRQYPQYQEVVYYLKGHWGSIAKCHYFNRTRRISGIALKLSVRLYYLLSYLNRKRFEVHPV